MLSESPLKNTSSPVFNFFPATVRRAIPTVKNFSILFSSPKRQEARRDATTLNSMISLSSYQNPSPSLPAVEIPNNPPVPQSTGQNGNTQNKKKRKRTSPQQLEVLENTFGTTHHPNLAHRNQLAAQLGMSLRSVQIWFQNRRAKERNKEYKHSKINPKKASDAALLTSIPEIIQEKNLMTGSMMAIDNSSLSETGEVKVHLSTPGSTTGSSTENVAMVLEQLSNIASEVDLSNPSNLNTLKGEITARLSEQGLSLIFTSTVLGGETQLAELLESSAVDVNIVDCEENTPLMVAAALGHEKIVEQLLAHGANPNRANKHGCTPLYAALTNGHPEIALKLIQLGADVNTKDRVHEQSPLHVAALNGLDEVISALLKAENINIHSVDAVGRTPLHHAAVVGFVEGVKLLLKHGANPNAQDKGGRTPLQAAELRGHTAVVHLIETHLKQEVSREEEDGEGLVIDEGAGEGSEGFSYD